jgi:hypothetical protein
MSCGLYNLSVNKFTLALLFYVMFNRVTKIIQVTVGRKYFLEGHMLASPAIDNSEG